MVVRGFHTVDEYSSFYMSRLMSNIILLRDMCGWFVESGWSEMNTCVCCVSI